MSVGPGTWAHGKHHFLQSASKLIWGDRAHPCGNVNREEEALLN